MPSRVHSASVGYKLHLRETDSQETNYLQFHDASNSVGWSLYTAPSTQSVQALQHLTFEVELTLLDIFSTDGALITQQFIGDASNDDEESKEDVPPMARQVDVPLAQYEWSISDAEMLAQLREAEHSAFFRSQLFELHNFWFFMQITPNGANPADKGNFGCFLYLACLPPSIWKLTLFYELELVETGTLDRYATEATQQRTTCGWFRNLNFSDIVKLDTLTFRVKVGIIDFLDKAGNVASLEAARVNPSNMSFRVYATSVWKIRNRALIRRIKSAAHQEYFDGPVFGERFKFQIRFTPNGQDDKTRGESSVGIVLLALPDRVEGVSVFFELGVEETGTHWTYCVHFRESYMTQSWQTCRIKFADLAESKHFTLNCTISLLAVYISQS